MKVFIVFSVFFLAVASANSFDELYAEEWALFKAEHGKSYDKEEDMKRMSVFLENKLFVAEHNERFLKGEVTYDVELNKYSDWLPEELENLLGTPSGRKVTVPELNREVFVPSPNFTAPDEVNWVKVGAVTNVKDQLTCGSCYAFSAVGALEGQMFLRKKQKLESLSPQNIVDCSRPQGNQGCTLGLASFSFTYVRENKGINSESVYPYESKEGTCRFQRDKVAATCTGYVEVEKDEKRLQEAVAAIGPIAIELDASHKSFFQYRSGVYSEPKCQTNNLTHAVLLVGYGTESGKPYWFIKNSWSTSWGLQGYMKLARNANNMCGVATLATYPKV